MAYNEKLSAQLKADGCKITVLCRKDLDSAILAERPDFYPCFSRFSWQIGNPKASGTHADKFEAELSLGLNEVLRSRSLASEENEPLLIYMYCGGVEHAEILEKHGLRIGAAVHVNLFYLSFHLTDQYARSHRQFFEFLANPPADGSFVATVSTAQLGSRLAKMTGCKLPCAPHPSTGVSDLKFESLRADAEHRFEFRKPLTVLFPSAPRPEKGYSGSCEAARIICSDPRSLRCIVKHAPIFSTPADLSQPIRKVEGMEVIEGALSDEEFLGLFARSQIAVLPYSPDAFAERTSGLLIDALYFGLPCVVLRGTWLSDIVEEYGCGVAVDGISARLLSEGVRTIADNHKHYRQRALRAADAYFEANSWHAFSEFLRSRGPTAPLERNPILTSEHKAVSTNPEVFPGFTLAGPNRWAFTKAKAGKQNLLIFKHAAKSPTANREILASFRIVCDASVQIAVTLARHDYRHPYEGATIKQKLTPGQTWSGVLKHRFKENHSDLKLQFEILDCPIATCTLEIQEYSVDEPALGQLTEPVVLAPNSFAQANKPEASQSFSFVSPNCWTFTKSLDSDKQEQLIFPANPPCPTKGREFLAVAILETNVYSEVEVSLGRHGSGAFEGQAAKIRLGAGQSTPVIICHKFISNHEKIKFQLKILSCAGDSAEVKVSEQFIFQSPESMVASLDKGEDVFALANSKFREARYLESAPLYLHLAHQEPKKAFPREMAEVAFQEAGLTDAELRKRILVKFGVVSETAK
jgi:glycosyltransferase involved in cell wall biosynthesis